MRRSRERDRHRIDTPLAYVGEFLADAVWYLEQAKQSVAVADFRAAEHELHELLDFLRRAEAEVEGARRRLREASGADPKFIVVEETSDVQADSGVSRSGPA